MGADVVTYKLLRDMAMEAQHIFVQKVYDKANQSRIPPYRLLVGTTSN